MTQNTDGGSNWDAWAEWGRRVEKRLGAQQTNVENMGAALRVVLARQRTEHALEIAALRQDLESLRTEIGAAKKLDEIMNRLDRIEGSPSRGSGLRAV